MPRARAHITGLLDAHQRQVDRIAELERLIAEVGIAHASVYLVLMQDCRPRTPRLPHLAQS